MNAVLPLSAHAGRSMRVPAPVSAISSDNLDRTFTKEARP